MGCAARSRARGCGPFRVAFPRTRRAPLGAPGSPVSYAACTTGFAWMHAWQAAQTMSVFGRRSASGKIALRVPLGVITARCARYRRRGKPWHRTSLQNLPDYDIVRIYGAAEDRAPVVLEGYPAESRRQLLPACPGCLAAPRAVLERRAIHAQDPGSQAPLHRRQDRGPLQGQSPYRQLNAGKTLITHARTRPARFLGYEIQARGSRPGRARPARVGSPNGIQAAHP
jgi:hypothetical protein